MQGDSGKGYKDVGMRSQDNLYKHVATSTFNIVNLLIFTTDYTTISFGLLQIILQLPLGVAKLHGPYQLPLLYTSACEVSCNGREY